MAVGFRAALLIVLAGVVLLPVTPAAAEPYAGLFVGGAFSLRNDVEQDLFPGTFEDVRFDKSIVFGGKAGYFFDPPVGGGNFGLELEVYHFRPNIDTQTVTFSTGGFSGEVTLTGADVRVTPIVLNALYRLPLTRNADFPQGRIHPYVGVGLGAFIATLESRTTVLDVNTSFSDTDVRPGFQAIAGTRFFLTRHIALFAEYKFVRTADFSFNLISKQGTVLGGPALEIRQLEFHLTTHMLQAGLAYHW